MGKKDENKKIKREALLSSAFGLFTEKGIQKTTISDIAKEAKLAKGTFYLYFKDKYDIRDKLIAVRGGKIIEGACVKLLKDVESRKLDLEDLEGEKKIELAINYLADYVINHFENNKALLKFISKNLSVALFSGGNTEEEMNRLIELFDKIIEKSGMKFRDKKIMFYMVIEVINSTAYDCIIRCAPTTIDQMKPEIYASLKNLIIQFKVSEQ